MPSPRLDEHELKLETLLDLSQNPADPAPLEMRIRTRGFPDYQFRSAARSLPKTGGAQLLFGLLYQQIHGALSVVQQSYTPISALDKEFTWAGLGSNAGSCFALGSNWLVQAPFWLPREWELAAAKRASTLFLNGGYPYQFRQTVLIRAPLSGPASLPAPCAHPSGPLRWRLEWADLKTNAIRAELLIELIESEISGAGIGQFQSQVQALRSALALPALVALSPQNPAKADGQYEFHSPHDPDGIGKFYLGREIAQVMGHPGASWLERPERISEEKPDLLVQSLGLKVGDVVADIGAGTGYITGRLAREVGESGRVYAVDIQPEMLAWLQRKMADEKIPNVQPVLGTEQDPNLPPDGVDLALMVDVYHEFAFPSEMLEKICRSLRTGGRLVFVEYRGEDPKVPIKRLHKMTEDQVRRETSLHPLQWEKTIRTLPRQHVIIFRKKSMPISDSSKERGARE